MQYFEDKGFFVSPDSISNGIVENLKVVVERNIEDIVHNLENCKEVVVLHVPLSSEWLKSVLITVPNQVISNNVKYSLDSCRVIAKKPNSRNLPWHQDKPVEMISYWIPLDDVNNHNGALTLKPSTISSTPVHPVCVAEGNLGETLDYLAMGTTIEEFSRDAETVEMTAGQILVFSGKTAHSSTPNNSSKWRHALVFRYLSDAAVFPDETSDDHKKFGNITGIEFIGSNRYPQLASPVFHTGGGRGGRGGRHGHGHGRGNNELVLQQQQAINLQQQMILQQQQQITALMQENILLERRIIGLNAQNAQQADEIQRIRARLNDIRAQLAQLGVPI
eukprot:TRINITY_DN7518_c0_g1_i1.p1 TRINITY_DN7518_c0_g1~~TRINITY_DN7518_c0_g1_i1.p1  ORF type:complete len:334 (-),score=55.43 TRINITY_DN7518_c0_g1_i1:33-1034(-)